MRRQESSPRPGVAITNQNQARLAADWVHGGAMVRFRISKGNKNIQGSVFHSVPSYCSFQTVRCYRDRAGKGSAITIQNATSCLMSPADLLPWEICKLFLLFLPYLCA